MILCMNKGRGYSLAAYTVELQWLEHLWDHGKVFEPWEVRDNEG